MADLCKNVFSLRLPVGLEQKAPRDPRFRTPSSLTSKSMDKWFAWVLSTSINPQRDQNYYRTWQDIFGTHDPSEVPALAAERASHFDRVWLVRKGNSSITVMTDGKVPVVAKDPETGEAYMLFPRLAYDGPALNNGFREFIKGNGVDYTPEEREILLRAFWQTREGVYQSPGDLLLVDNLRFGHSREPYLEHHPETGDELIREAVAYMAGQFSSE